MKVSQSLLKHVPLIKFVGGPHKHAKSAAGVHPMAPNGIRPASNSSYFNASSIEPEEGVFFSRSQLSNRFQYKLPKEDEADNIITGGAEVVF